MKVYEGRRAGTCECVVTVDGKPLPLRLDLANHSPTGFEWGYYGSGPAQLALAILADHFGRDRSGMALERYQAFKFTVVGRLAHDEWRLTTVEIEAWLKWWLDQPAYEVR